jgi:ATP-dependent RNA helicase DDX31/DBP7
VLVRSDGVLRGVLPPVFRSREATAGKEDTRPTKRRKVTHDVKTNFPKLSKKSTKPNISPSTVPRKNTSSQEATKSEKPKTEEKIGQPKFKPPKKSHIDVWNRNLSGSTKAQSDIFCDMSFGHFGLQERLLKHLAALNFIKPTLIQKAAIPSIMQRRDVMVQAETGSGKTLTYLIPMIHDLLSFSLTRSDGTYAIVIAPTRELSLQIHDVLQSLVRPFPWIVATHIVGGEKRKSEKARLRKGVTVVVATPGRLLDHILHTSAFNYSHIRWLILDEADRLLDMGFEKELLAIMKHIDEKSLPNLQRQTLLLSATLNKDINRLALASLRNPVYISLDEIKKAHRVNSDVKNGDSDDNKDDNKNVITINNDNAIKSMDISNEKNSKREELNMSETALAEELNKIYSHGLPSGLRQHFVIVQPKWRLVCLAAFIRQKALERSDCKMIVFVSSMDAVEFYFALFGSVKLPKSTKAKPNQEIEMEDLIPMPMFKLYGSMTQEERRGTYLKFCKTKNGVMFCTDVAARGLDMPNITWIVQYDVPTDPAAYIHRIGRTARLGHSGDALLFLFPSEKPYIDILKGKNMQFNEVTVDDILAPLVTNLEANPKKIPLVEAAALQREFERVLEDDESMNEDLKLKAVKAYRTFIRSYATHSRATKHIFHIKNLHLGHLSKSFALKESPSSFGKLLAKQKTEKERKKKKVGLQHKKSKDAVNYTVLNEFAAG